jgi:pteridine reductase
MRPTALVTGASDRVGRAVAVEFARRGFEVGVHYRSNEAGAEQTALLCEQAGGSAWTVRADLSTIEGCDTVVDQTRKRWSYLHVLVHNASAFAPRPFAGLGLEEWDMMLGVHARAPFLLTQGLLTQLIAADSVAPGAEKGEGGVVVGLVDIGAERPVPGYTAYSVSKAALAMLVKCLAVELAPRVRAVGVSPGQVAWPPDYSEAKRRALAERIPMKRVGTPEDVARLVRFLALEAPYINGEIIAVDGGLSKRY